MAARVIGLRQLSRDGFELTMERDGLDFSSGQLITIHGRDPLSDRSYTISSGERDAFIQVLFRLMPVGRLTPELVARQRGDVVEFSGPFGEFIIRDPARPIIFIATGTGVAPCRSYLHSHPHLNLTLVHGVRNAEDLFYREEFARIPYHPCMSGPTGDGFRGRVTDFCVTRAFPPDAHYYLCGANEMFYDMRDLLAQRGVRSDSIFTEAYYYRSDE